MMYKKAHGIIIAMQFCVISLRALGTWCPDPTQPVTDYYATHGDTETIKKILDDALAYFRTVEPTDKSIILFDIDNTVLRLGNWFDATIHIFCDYPALAEILEFYKQLHSMGFKMVFLTARYFTSKKALTRNLSVAGYTNFERLIKRSLLEHFLSNAAFKRKKWQELKDEGYTIIGSVGNKKHDHGTVEETGYAVILPTYSFSP